MLIRRANLNELEEIRDFYNENWGIKHALVNVKAYIDFYFVSGEYLNFVIARESEHSEIISACGYVLSNSTSTPDIWTTLWLTKKNVGANVGLQILDFMSNKMGFRIVSSGNIRPKTAVLYKFLNYETAKMEHYYRLSDKKSYDVAVINQREILPYESTQYSIKLLKSPNNLIETFDDSTLAFNKPYKDLSYIIKRYYHFPFYSYMVYGIIGENKQCKSVIVLRKADVNNTSVLRIVDLVGRLDDIKNIGRCMQDLLDIYECEYIDFYCYGLSSDMLTKAGFSRCSDSDGNIIPNYLEPYAPIDTEYHLFSSEINGFTMFKADGDQDKLYIELF